MEAKEKLRIKLLLPNNLLSLTFSFNSSEMSLFLPYYHNALKCNA